MRAGPVDQSDLSELCSCAYNPDVFLYLTELHVQRAQRYQCLLAIHSLISSQSVVPTFWIPGKYSYEEGTLGRNYHASFHVNMGSFSLWNEKPT